MSERPSSYVIVFRSRLMPGVEEEYLRHAGEIYAMAERMPGLLGTRDYAAADGERLTIIEFDTEEHLHAWRDHVEHRRAQAEGRERYYTSYSIQICRVERASAFDRGAGTWTQLPGPW